MLRPERVQAAQRHVSGVKPTARSVDLEQESEPLPTLGSEGSSAQPSTTAAVGSVTFGEVVCCFTTAAVGSVKFGEVVARFTLGSCR